MFKKIAAIAATLTILLMAYGFWRVSTYGWLYLSIQDVSGQEKKYQLIKDAKIMLLDSNGNVLAEGKSDSRHGVVYLYHSEAGFCVEEESRASFSKDDRQDWYNCYEKQAKWVVEWVRKVKYVDLEFDNCHLKRVPVSVSESKNDWWLWWVPHPHIGGKPSTYFNIDIFVDRVNCKVETL